MEAAVDGRHDESCRLMEASTFSPGEKKYIRGWFTFPQSDVHPAHAAAHTEDEGSRTFRLDVKYQRHITSATNNLKFSPHVCWKVG